MRRSRMGALALCLLVALAGCSAGLKKARAPKSNNIPAGTEVPFSKAMNEGYAEEYIGADIVTMAEFLAPGKGAYHIDVPKNHIVFQAVSPGGKGQSNPFSGQAMGEFVLIHKDAGDLVFELERGDLIELRGGTEVKKGHGLFFATFRATSIQRAEN